MFLNLDPFLSIDCVKNLVCLFVNVHCWELSGITSLKIFVPHSFTSALFSFLSFLERFLPFIFYFPFGQDFTFLLLLISDALFCSVGVSFLYS